MPTLANTLRRVSTLASQAVFKAELVGRVVRQTGILRAVRPEGARVLLSSVRDGKRNPSLLFRFLAHNEPTRAAIIEPHSLLSNGSLEDRVITFAELDRRIDQIGAALSRRGIAPGSGVLLMLKNRAEFIILQPALGRIGLSAVSVSYRSTGRELEYIAENSQAKAIFFDTEVESVVRTSLPNMRIPRENYFAVGGEASGFMTLENLADLGVGRAEDRSEEAAVIMYTSGTTGKPKGAVRRFRNDALLSALAVIGETPMKVGGVHLAVCPLYHATAFGFVSLSFVVGGTAVVLQDFRPDLFLEAVERYRVTSTALVPTMLHRLVELGREKVRKYDLSSLRSVFSGGAQLPAPLARDFMDMFGDILYNFYGSTETGVVTLAGPHDLRNSPGTIGRVVPGNEIRLINEAGADCAEGEVGELYVRSAMLVEGYHRDSEATRKSMLDGYFSVGDLARKDPRGCYHIEGRKRDMIISGGVNVYPAEVEAVLEAHPAIREVAVVGVPDREWGERVRAFLAFRQGTSCEPEELKAYCRTRLSGPKIPREFVFLDALPRNPTGKVLKRELRDRT